jgi:hypothetical protein
MTTCVPPVRRRMAGVRPDAASESGIVPHVVLRPVAAALHTACCVALAVVGAVIAMRVPGPVDCPYTIAGGDSRRPGSECIRLRLM